MTRIKRNKARSRHEQQKRGERERGDNTQKNYKSRR